MSIVTRRADGALVLDPCSPETLLNGTSPKSNSNGQHKMIARIMSPALLATRPPDEHGKWILTQGPVKSVGYISSEMIVIVVQEEMHGALVLTPDGILGWCCNDRLTSLSR